MDQNNEHIKKLTAAREIMVDQRRQLADALSAPYKGGQTERMRESFVAVQATIEAPVIEALKAIPKKLGD